jgi:hypothetical protein
MVINMKSNNLIFRKKIAASEVVNRYPAIWKNDYKKKIFDISCPNGCSNSGKLIISRYSTLPIPTFANIDADSTEIIFREDTFQYEVNSDKNVVEWYLNFADGDLFFHYGSKLMAQDEHQVAEHPVLASVREMLFEYSENNRDYDPCTRDYTRTDYNPPTPILIIGAERKIKIDLSKNSEKGRPKGLYGKQFNEAPWETVEMAVQKLDFPTFTNIIAMEAFSGGKGNYTIEQIKDIFQTAHTAFSAAITESRALAGENVKILIHTGNWGTGAYGGNKVLMAYLQLLSAAIAQVDTLVYHSKDHESYQNALNLFCKNTESYPSKIKLEKLFKELTRMGFKWGESDGN